MSRCPKNPLRPLLEEERRRLTHLSRCQAAPASQVARAKAVLAVADGDSYTAAAGAPVAGPATPWRRWLPASTPRV